MRFRRMIFLGFTLFGNTPLVALAQPTPDPTWLLLYPQDPRHHLLLEKQQKNQVALPTVPPQVIVPPIVKAPIASDGVNPPKTPTGLPVAKTPPPELSPSKETKPEVIALPPFSPPLFIETLPPPPPPAERYPKYVPALSSGIPSAFGANWGDVSVGAGLIDREGSAPTSPNARAGGSAAISFGVGDSSEYFGLETTYNIISLTPSRFASNGSFDFKLHKNLGNLTAIAVGWDNAINYGPEAGGTESSVYGVISKLFVLKPGDPENPMVLGFSAGVGGGGFRPFNDQINRVGSIGVFGSVGIQALSNIALSATWTGQTMNFGVSYVPFRDIPFTLTAVAVDAFNNTEFKTRYLLGGGFSFKFR
jgi:hypothetical protein